MWLLPAFSLLSSAVGRIYYRLRVAGEGVPRTGPVLLVANHPNSLLDPILVCAVAGRPVRFLAKAQLFTHPIWGWMMRGVGAIPVYRRMDDPTVMGRNVDMFRAVFDELSKGAAIGIFPEGVSHSEPSLVALKSGAARIALGTFEKQPRVFPIIPIGLVFRQKDVFRSEAMVVLGRPVAWDDLALRGLEDKEAVRELTARIEAGLRPVTVNLERWEDKPLIECAEAIWTAEWGADGDPASRVARLEVTTTILGQLRRDPEAQWSSLLRDVSAHFRRLRVLGLRPAHLGVDIRLRTSIPWTARRLYLLGLPAIVLAVAGYVLFWAPYQLTHLVTRAAAPLEYQRSTFKLFIGIASYALWILLLAAAVGWIGGPLAGVGALFVIALVGLLGRRIRERWGSAWHDTRRFFLLRSRKQLIETLKEHQRDLAVRLNALYETLEVRPEGRFGAPPAG